jgi:hypothetical protein
MTDCNFCPENNGAATHDSPTKYGPWGYTCDTHFAQYGMPGGTLLQVAAPKLALVGKASDIYERQANPDAPGSVMDDIAGLSLDEMFDYFADTDPSEFL